MDSQTRPELTKICLVLDDLYRRTWGETATAGLCVQAHGFSLHAGVRCGAHRRQELERMCRYITRPAIASAKPGCKGPGRAAIEEHMARRQRTSGCHRCNSCSAWPRWCLIRFHGVLAPNA